MSGETWLTQIVLHKFTVNAYLGTCPIYNTAAQKKTYKFK